MKRKLGFILCRWHHRYNVANDQQQSIEAFRQSTPVYSVVEGTYEPAHQLSIELSDLDQHPIDTKELN